MTLMRKFWSLLLTGLVAGSVSVGAHAESCPRPAQRPFRIFDATAYVGRPDMSRYGIEPIHIIDRGLWPDGANQAGPPDAGPGQALSRRPAARQCADRARYRALEFCRQR